MHQNQRHIERAAIEHFQILHLQLFKICRIPRVQVRKAKKSKYACFKNCMLGQFSHTFSVQILFIVHTHSSSSLEAKIQNSWSEIDSKKSNFANLKICFFPSKKPKIDQKKAPRNCISDPIFQKFPRPWDPNPRARRHQIAKRFSAPSAPKTHHFLTHHQYRATKQFLLSRNICV